MKELKLITQSLYKFEKWLYGFNYECHFRYERINESLNIQEACQIISQRYPFPPAAQSLQLISYDEFINDISEKLRYRGDTGAGVRLSQKQEVEFEKELANLKELLQQTFDPSETAIYIHPEITTWIFWGFCFLLASEKHNANFLLEGISSD
jgi:hypothetical protein